MRLHADKQFAAEIEEYGKQTKEIQPEAKKLEREMRFEAKRTDRFDLGEVFLEIALVITSITLLSGNRLFWYCGIVLGISWSRGGRHVPASSLSYINLVHQPL